MSRDEITRLIKDAERQVLSGDLTGAAGRFERAAKAYEARRSHRDAATAWLTAARVRLMMGDPDRAEALLDHADAPAAKADVGSEVLHVRAELADARGDPDHRRTAWRAFADAVTGAATVTALRRLAAVERETGRLAEARDLAGEAAERATAAGLDELATDCALERTAARLALGEADVAAELEALASRIPIEAHPHRARWLEQQALAAQAAGRLQHAIEHARAARSAAVGCTDVQTYLAASMLLFALHDMRDEPVAAYDTLVRARESLIQLMGTDAAAWVQPALDAFAARLGDARMASVHEAWATWSRDARRR